MLLLKRIPNYRNKVTVNYSSNLFSNSIDASNPVYLPNSTHQTPTDLASPSYYMLELVEEVTGKVYDTLLVLSGYSSNARFLKFDLYLDTSSRSGAIDLERGGKYVYNVYGVLENTQYPATVEGKSNQNARVLIDTGLAMVYENYDFVNTYYNADTQTIPTVISYKNE